LAISGNISGSVSAANTGAGASKAIRSTGVLRASGIAAGNSRVSTNTKGTNAAKELAFRLPGASAESNVSDGETATSERKKLENNLTKEKKEEQAKKNAEKAVKDSTVKDGVKNVNDKDQKINDKVTEDQFGRDITDPKSQNDHNSRFDEIAGKEFKSDPDSAAERFGLEKSPGSKGASESSLPPAQPPLASGQGAGSGIGFGGGGFPGAGGSNLNGSLPPGTGPEIKGGSEIPPSGESITNPNPTESQDFFADLGDTNQPIVIESPDPSQDRP